MKKLLSIMILLVFSFPVYGNTVYKWVDEKGVVNFTDDYKKISPQLRNRVETEEFLEGESRPALPPSRTDTDNDNRNYWNRQLDEATLNYKKAREELLEAGERLVSHRYGGKTQYQMFTEALPSMSERLELYKEQMNEAKAMLKSSTNEPEVSGGKRVVSSGTDVYGRDERWWKEKARPWKEQMSEAREGYEKASEAFIQQLERLGPYRWGGLSLTQYQFISTKLTSLNGQMMRFQNQISEASGMLTKLFREAMETKADPAWLE